LYFCKVSVKICGSDDVTWRGGRLACTLKLLAEVVTQLDSKELAPMASKALGTGSTLPSFQVGEEREGVEVDLL
jgi:hypothetical protein